MEMKLIMYSSKAPIESDSFGIPAGLSAIVKTCQKNNAIFNISGALYFSHGHYLQVIEGNRDAVDRLMVNILKDTRHKNCIIQFDFKIKKRMFPRWQCQLALLPSKDPYFHRLLSEHPEQLQSMSSAGKAALKQFFKKPTPRQKTTIASVNTHCSLDVFGSEVISLIELPDFSKLDLPPIMINLCRLLTRQPHSLEQLVVEYGVGKRDDILSLLRDLNNQGLLEFIDDEPERGRYSYRDIYRVS